MNNIHKIFASHQKNPSKFNLFDIHASRQITPLVLNQCHSLLNGQHKRILVLIYGRSVKSVSKELMKHTKGCTRNDCDTLRVGNQTTGGVVLIRIFSIESKAAQALVENSDVVLYGIPIPDLLRDEFIHI